MSYNSTKEDPEEEAGDATNESLKTAAAKAVSNADAAVDHFFKFFFIIILHQSCTAF